MSDRETLRRYRVTYIICYYYRWVTESIDVEAFDANDAIVRCRIMVRGEPRITDVEGIAQAPQPGAVHRDDASRAAAFAIWADD